MPFISSASDMPLPLPQAHTGHCTYRDVTLLEVPINIYALQMLAAPHTKSLSYTLTHTEHVIIVTQKHDEKRDMHVRKAVVEGEGGAHLMRPSKGMSLVFPLATNEGKE